MILVIKKPVSKQMCKKVTEHSMALHIISLVGGGPEIVSNHIISHMKMWNKCTFIPKLLINFTDEMVNVLEVLIMLGSLCKGKNNQTFWIERYYRWAD